MSRGTIGVLLLLLVPFAGCKRFASAADAGARATAESSSAAALAPLPPDLVAAPRDGYVALALTSSAACAVHASGRVACWGERIHGKGTEWRSSDVPAWVDGLAAPGATVQRLAASDAAVCATKANGEAWCWGLGPWGATLGAGYAFVPTRAPHLVGLRIAMAPELDGHHGCGLDTNGDVLCWGDGPLGETGVGPGAGYRRPSVLLHRAVQVGSGRRHSCALLATGSVVCWGYGEHGALGDGDPHERPCRLESAPSAPGVLPGPQIRKCVGPEPVFTPRAATALGWARLLAPSGRCAVTSEPGAKPGPPEIVTCWGEGWSPIPSAVMSGPEVADVVELAGADAIGCARTKAGDVTCFGAAPSGQVRFPIPTRIPELRGAIAVAARGLRVCGIVPGGRVRCIGKNASALDLVDWTTR